MSSQSLWLIQSAAALVLLALTAAVGRRPERTAVAGYLGAWALALAGHEIFDGRYAVGVMLAADVALLLLFVRLGWKSDRTWPIWATGPQAVLVAVHVAYAREPAVGREALVAAINLATFAVLGLMVWGAVRTRFRAPAERG